MVAVRHVHVVAVRRVHVPGPAAATAAALLYRPGLARLIVQKREILVIVLFIFLVVCCYPFALLRAIGSVGAGHGGVMLRVQRAVDRRALVETVRERNEDQKGAPGEDRSHRRHAGIAK